MWSLVASLSRQDECLDSSAVLGDQRVMIEPGVSRYRWAAKNASLFSASGLPKNGEARLSIYLVQDESSAGRILCFACTLRMRDLRCDYPPQMTADALCPKPRRNSIRFGAPDKQSSPAPKRDGYLLQCCSETHGTDARFQVLYNASLRYGAKGMVQIHLDVFSVELKLSCYQVLEAYFRRPEGHRLVMECNGQYVGGPQSLDKYPVTTPRTKDQGSTYVYQWLTTTKRPPTPRMTKEELYDVAIIDGLPVEDDEKDPLKRRASTPVLGTLMSPRTPNSNVKTPRPDSHVRKQELVPPPFVPDSPEKHNETRRLYAAIGKSQRVRIQLFNFRFTPPRRMIHRLTYTDFAAAYGRTLAKHKIQAGDPAEAEGREGRLKIFRRHSKRRLSEREQHKQQEETEKEQMTCRLEREIAVDMLLVVHFSFSQRQSMVFMRKVELLVQDARKTLNFENTQT